MSKSIFIIKKNCENKIPDSKKLNATDNKLLNNLKDNLSKIVLLMDNQNLNDYIKMVISFSFDANKYFNDSEPWSLKKTNPERMRTIIFTISEQIKNISILLNPIIPLATNKVLKAMNISESEINLSKIKNLNVFNHTKELNDLDILFTKIENDN